jgi:hypothetical protein
MSSAVSGVSRSRDRDKCAGSGGLVGYGHTVHDRSECIATKYFEQALFHFDSDLIQHILDTCIHALAANGIFRCVWCFDGLIDFGECDVIG